MATHHENSNSQSGKQVVPASGGIAWENPTPVGLPTPLRLKPGLRTAAQEVSTLDGGKAVHAPTGMARQMNFVAVPEAACQECDA